MASAAPAPREYGICRMAAASPSATKSGRCRLVAQFSARQSGRRSMRYLTMDAREAAPSLAHKHLAVGPVSRWRPSPAVRAGPWQTTCDQTTELVAEGVRARCRRRSTDRARELRQHRAIPARPRIASSGPAVIWLPRQSECAAQPTGASEFVRERLARTPYDPPIDPANFVEPGDQPLLSIEARHGHDLSRARTVRPR